jgi:hypothetical protein
MTEIRHWSYFPTREAQLRFAAAVAELGYSIENIDEEAPEPNRFCVCFSKLQNTDDLEAIWEQLSTVSAGCDGEYDGHEFALDDDPESTVSLN